MKIFLPLMNGTILLLCLIKGISDGEHLLSFLLFCLLSVVMLVPLFLKKAPSGNSGRKRMFKKFKRNKSALFGLCVLLLILYLAILAPFAAPYDPDQIDYAAFAAKPNAQHWFGTDELGRDVLSRILYGYRVALGLGISAVLMNSILGTFLGMAAGYYGRKTDTIIMRALEVWDSIPFILLAIAVMAALGTGLVKLVIVVSLSGILSFARIIRGSVLLVKQQDYIAAGKVIGLPDSLLLFRHILPNCLAPVIVLASLRVGETILTVAGLSFLGLGIQPPMASLGYMLSTSQQYISQNIFMSLFPGLAILMIVFSMNLFGDGLRDALDSKLTE